MTRQELIETWDSILRDWPQTEEELRDDLRAWYDSYKGKGKGKPTLDAMPEPYVGPLGGDPALIMLGLNPGPADLAFQGKTAPFSAQVRETSYSTWAASDPYGSEQWETKNTVNPSSKSGRRPNRYRAARIRFANEWHQTSGITGSDLLTVELYPWHSNNVTSALKPPSNILNDWVWEPLAGLGDRDIFAFGKPWIGVTENLDFSVINTWPAKRGHFRVASRGMAAYQLPSNQRLIVIHQSGYAGPPRHDEIKTMRRLLGE